MRELSYLNKFLFKYRYRLLLGLVFVTISNIFGVLPAQIIRISFDLVNDNINYYKLFDGFDLQTSTYTVFGNVVLLFGALVLLTALIRGIFLFFMRQTIIVVSRLIEYDLKNEIYGHYQKLTLAFYRRNNTGDLMNRVSEDVSRVRMYLGPGIMYTINTVVLFILVTATMFSINPKLTFYTLLPLPIMGLTIYYVHSLINKRSEEIQEQLSNLSTFTQESFSGIRVLKAFVKEKAVQESFNVESENYKNRSMVLAKVQALFMPAFIFLVGISILLTVYVGGIEVAKGNITPGNIAEFIVYVNLLTFPAMALGWITSMIQRAAASQKRINEFLNTQPEIISTSTLSKKIEGDIEFRNVSLTYPDTGIKALDSVSFQVKKGEIVAIIGRTGSGKSTIANLLSRMYDATDGDILLDGISLKKYSLQNLREQIGVVPQEVFLFSDTIRNNIAFGNERMDEQAIKEAAKNAAILDSILDFPQTFDTQLGERGITLSGGQKQRISIARAIAKEPEILIFDDCLSAVDTKTEEEILSNLGEIMRGKTSIIISHRVSTIKNADKIIVLDNGRIIEEGTHNSLLNKKGAYFTLYEKQLLDEELVA